MPWWAIILLLVGVAGGVPAIAFAFFIGLDLLRERGVPDVEQRAEALGREYTGSATSTPRPAVGLSGLRESLDAAARYPRSEPLRVEPHLPRDRPDGHRT